MAGTIVASYLNDGTTSGSTTDMVKGSARAWVNFNGTGTVTIIASYNVSSITDNGTGDYYVNFTTSMPNTNYATVVSACDTPTFNRMTGPYPSSETTRIRVMSSAYISGPTQYDSIMNVAIFR